MIGTLPYRLNADRSPGPMPGLRRYGVAKSSLLGLSSVFQPSSGKRACMAYDGLTSLESMGTLFRGAGRLVPTSSAIGDSTSLHSIGVTQVGSVPICPIGVPRDGASAPRDPSWVSPDLSNRHASADRPPRVPQVGSVPICPFSMPRRGRQIGVTDCESASGDRPKRCAMT